MTLLDGRNVRHVYGCGRRRDAVCGVSFTAEPGEIVGLVGPNGAGKTTLLRLIAGELSLTSGALMVAGHRAGTRAARQQVGFAPDPPIAPSELSGIEWLTYLGSHAMASAAERGRAVSSALELAELESFAGRRIATYSRGMMQRLALAAAAVADPAVLLLDETLAGVDPLVHRRLRHRIARLAGQGKLLVIASHDLATVERLATRVLVVWGGRLRADVSTTCLLTERVAELTLSGSALATVDRMLVRYGGAMRTGAGIAIPLRGGLTVEQVLADCRDQRIAVAASRVRYRALEDIFLEAAGRRDELA